VMYGTMLGLDFFKYLIQMFSDTCGDLKGHKDENDHFHLPNSEL